MLDDRDVRLIDEGDEAPFSKGLMAQTLMATGLAPEQAYGVAAAVERRLRRRGPAALTLADLHEIAREQLGDLQGDILIQRFRQRSAASSSAAAASHGAVEIRNARISRCQVSTGSGAGPSPMPPILDAAGVYATAGEISHRLRGVFGEHREG